MDSQNVQVLSVSVAREEIDLAHETAGADIRAALEALSPGSSANLHLAFPLAREKAVVVLDGVPTAVANALRRALKDEILGRCLTFDGADFSRTDTTDPFMADDDFIRTRLRMIPLRPQISESLVKSLSFSLDAANPSDTVRTIYSGDLVVAEGALAEPIFNPFFELAFLQPGKTLRIDKIRIAEGLGSHDAAFNVAARAVSRPLDLETHPRSSTHGPPSDPLSLQSGYVESSLVANPRRHEIVAFLPAAPAGVSDFGAVLVDACLVVMRRLRYVQSVLDGPSLNSDSSASHRASNAYFLLAPDGSRTKGLLSVGHETDTIGNLITRYLYELTPDIAYAGYTCIHHEKVLKITVCHHVSEPCEIKALFIRAVKHAYAVFDSISKRIRALASSRA